MNDERPPCPKCHAPYHLEGAERYWEARWRDEKKENERLRRKLEEIHDITQDTTLNVECWQKLQNIEATATSALSLQGGKP